MEKIKINGEYIKLVQLLKLAGIISTGGEIKSLIANEEIFVNDVIETRIRAKIYPGDIVFVRNEKLGVEIDN